MMERDDGGDFTRQAPGCAIKQTKTVLLIGKIQGALNPKAGDIILSGISCWHSCNEQWLYDCRTIRL